MSEDIHNKSAQKKRAKSPLVQLVSIATEKFSSWCGIVAVRFGNRILKTVF
jgi:hypothetical protein